MIGDRAAHGHQVDIDADIGARLRAEHRDRKEDQKNAASGSHAIFSLCDAGRDRVQSGTGAAPGAALGLCYARLSQTRFREIHGCHTRKSPVDERLRDRPHPGPAGPRDPRKNRGSAPPGLHRNPPARRSSGAPSRRQNQEPGKSRGSGRVPGYQSCTATIFPPSPKSRCTTPPRSISRSPARTSS